MEKRTSLVDDNIVITLDNIEKLSKILALSILKNFKKYAFGGSSKIAGLYEYAKQKLDIPIIVPENPEDAVILGAGKLLNAGNDFLKIDL